MNNLLIEELVYQLIFLIAVFICIILHELGHCLVARKFNIQTKHITILPIGCIAEMTSIPEKPSEELLISVAGPLVNIIIAILIYLSLGADKALYYSQRMLDSASFLEINFFFGLFVTNLMLAFFNLMPAFPMDGGRVLRALLAMRLNRKKATKIAARIGQFLALIFIFIGFSYSILLCFVGAFIFISAEKEIKY